MARGKYARKRAPKSPTGRWAAERSALEIKLRDIVLDAGHGFYVFNSPAPPPRPAFPEEAAETISRLNTIRFDMKALRFTVRMPESFLAPAIVARADIALLRREDLPMAPPVVDLIGAAENLRIDDTPADIVAAARRAMLGLFTHELDEVLFAAGLGLDPHAYQAHELRKESREWFQSNATQTLPREDGQ